MKNNILWMRDFINIQTLKVIGEETNIKHLSPNTHFLKSWCIEHP